MKQQAKLFSFFNAAPKKKEPVKGVAPGAPFNLKKAPAAKLGPSTANAGGSSGGKRSLSPLQPSPPVTEKSDDLSQSMVGRRIRVWDDDDECWHQGTVVNDKGGGAVRVEYTDVPEAETLVLSKEKYEWIPGSNAKDAKDESKRRKLGASKPTSVTDSKVRKRRTIAQEEDDDEDEEEAVFDDSASDMVAAESPEEAIDEEDGDDDDAWLADSDEEEEEDGEEEEFDDESSEDEKPRRNNQKKRPLKSGSKKLVKKTRTAPAIVPTPSLSSSSSSRKSSTATPKSSSRPSPFSLSSKSGPFSTTPRDSSSSSSSPPAAASPTASAAQPVGFGTHNHHKFEWRLKIDPEKPRKMAVPSGFMEKQTPAQMQWWDFKSRNRDLVILQKIGKFYEMYNDDADVGVREAGLSYMRGEQAHCGFPELGYGKYAELLVSKGYRVARIEQTESPEENKIRAKSAPGGLTKVQKTLFKSTRREVCSVLTPGTRTFNHLDDFRGQSEGEMRAWAREVGYVAPTSTILLAIKERRCVPSASGDDIPVACEYGVCLVDSPTSSIMLGQFEDDEQRTRLRTLLTQFPPAEVLLEMPGQGDEGASQETSKLLDLMAAGALKDRLVPGEEFWSAERTAREVLRSGKYFRGDDDDDDDDNKNAAMSARPAVPDALRQDDKPLALCALGGATWLLQRALIDHDVLTMGKVSSYTPVDLLSSPKSVTPSAAGVGGTSAAAATSTESGPLACMSDLAWVAGGSANPFASAEATTGANPDRGIFPVGSRMTLDAAALANLEVLVSTDGTTDGTLWKHMDKTASPFGRRLLRSWVCAPLMNAGEINARLDAVEELCGDASDVRSAVKVACKGLPDLDRLLSNVHSFGSKHRATEHPDSRAKLYDLDKFNKKKISKLADLVNGMKKLSQFARSVGTECGLPSSRLLAPLLTIDVDNADDTAAAAAPAGSRGAAGSPLRLFPDLAAHLKFFESSVNLSQAQRTGNIEPRLGMNAEYDRAAQDIDDIKGRLEDELRAERTGQLKGSGVKWFHHKSKVEDMYQLEIEETWLAKHTPPPGMYISKSKTKKARRFQTKAIVACLKELEAAEKRRADSRVDTMRAVFARFADAGDLWARAVRCVSTVDALCALAAVSNQHGYTRPAIVKEAGATSKKTAEAAAGGGAAPVVLDLQQVRHPCLVLPVGQEAIPNDTKLGGEEGHSGSTPRMLLLTGPNMGGKSTLLRCCCVVSIMAQLGCFVPGNEVRLSPIDRIFTRLGASDRILAGQSTFFVELSEAAAILHHATSRSMVILDELGRGTSTFDGTAIAHSVVHHLVTQVRCRALFATHYHSLVEDWSAAGNPLSRQVQLGHMACIVDPSNEDQCITFLYQLTSGSSPRSFGINVARLARLPKEILDLAASKSQDFEVSLRASADWQESVEIGKRFLAFATASSPESVDEQQLCALWEKAQTLAPVDL